MNVTIRGLAITGIAIDTTSDERFVAQVQAQGFMTRLSLLDAQGHLIVASDGLSPNNPDDLIDQHLTAGTYFLEVERTVGAGDYTLTTMSLPATAPFQPLTFSSSAYRSESIATGDFTGNGILDVVGSDGVYLGVGDGTFRTPSISLGLVGVPSEISAMITGDFTGDGHLDLALLSYEFGESTR